MARGKYAHRADTRLKVLESEALRKASARIAELEAELATAHNEVNTFRKQMAGKAMAAAAHLSGQEKKILRDKIASLEYQDAQARIRNAVLVWEIVHRNKFDRPSPDKIWFGNDVDDDTCDITPEQMTQTRDYWYSMHWEIAALFFSDYDEMRRFFLIVEGHEWRIAGENIDGVYSSTRHATRSLHTGKVRDSMMKREYERREYYERIWKAREAGHVEPIQTFGIIGTDEDIKENLVKKMKNREQR
jgi:hypothetical protein